MSADNTISVCVCVCVRVCARVCVCVCVCLFLCLGLCTRGGQGVMVKVEGGNLSLGSWIFGASGLRAFGYCVHHTCRSVSFVRHNNSCSMKIQASRRHNRSSKTLALPLNPRNSTPSTYLIRNTCSEVTIETKTNGEAATSTGQVSSWIRYRALRIEFRSSVLGTQCQ